MPTTPDTTRHRNVAALRSRADEENTGVVSILVDQFQELSRSQRDQGERLASVATSMAIQNDQLRTIAANVELIRAHISECPARSGWTPLLANVRDLQILQAETAKAPKDLKPTGYDSSGPVSIIPLKIKGRQLSPIVQILTAIATAIGAGLAGYLAK
jgi:hypothetical protein